METRTIKNSSWVAEISYDDRTMTVITKTGQTILYKDLEPEIWQRALAAESIGKFIHSVIKPMYKKDPDAALEAL